MKKTSWLILLALIFAFCFSLFFTDGVSMAASKRPKINVKRLTLSKNESYTLRVYNMKKKHTVSFSSDDTNIVSVRPGKGTRPKTATIYAVNNGSATIRTTVYNKKGRVIRSLKTNVKVTPYGISIKFTKKKVNLNVDETEKLSYIIKPNTSQEMPVFESSDTSIATINSRGIVTALAPGEVTITATLLSTGQKVHCHIVIAETDTNDSDSMPPGQQIRKRNPDYCTNNTL